MHVVIVCGGRTYGRVPDGIVLLTAEKQLELREQARHEREFLVQKLDELLIKRKRVKIVSGEALGADRGAKLWALGNGQLYTGYKADWKTYQKAAGFIRNADMLRDEQPDEVIAFCGGKGTANMIAISVKANVPVTIYNPDDVNVYIASL